MVPMALMSWWELAGWGFFGGFIAEGLPLWRMVEKNRGVWPPHYRSPGFFAAKAIRLLIGAGLAVLFGESGQVSGAIGAVAVGAAAPLIVEKLTQQLPSLPPQQENNSEEHNE